MTTLAEALSEIEKWKEATGLEDNRGDPDGITPELLKEYIEYLIETRDKQWGIADEAIEHEHKKEVDYYRKGLKAIVDRFCGDGEHERCSGCVDTAQFADRVLSKSVVL